MSATVAVAMLAAGLTAWLGGGTPASRVPAGVVEKPSTWDREHRSDLIALKSEAEQLAVAKQYDRSLAIFGKFFAAVGDHQIDDPVTRDLIASARAEQSTVFNAALADRPTAPGAVAAGASSPGTTASPRETFVRDSTTTGPTLNLPPESPRPIAARTETASVPSTQSTESGPPVVNDDPVMSAADNAPATSQPDRPALSLRAYTLPQQVTDDEIGDAINKGVRFLASQYKNGEVMTNLGDQVHFRNAPAAGPHQQAPAPAVAAGAPGVQGETNLDGSPSSDLPDAPQTPEQPGIPRQPAIRQQPGRRVNNSTPRPLTAQAPAPFVAPNSTVFSTPGLDALCTYALLQGNQGLDHPLFTRKDAVIEAVLEHLKQYDLVFTYHRSLRAAALAVLNRTEDNAALEEDVRWLIAANREGAYTYTSPSPLLSVLSTWDNSNSQYGLLGVWSGAQAGIAVPSTYWHQVDGHWFNCALNDGTWGYSHDTAGSLSMTCAGIASELVSRDYLNMPNGPGDAGLEWLDQGDNSTAGIRNSSHVSYTLYGLERVGLASGYKYFGKHDWYSELAGKLVAEQHENGSWGSGGTGTLIDTAYAVLFLARGRHPILFNKLRFDGDWNNHPRDTMHLSRYAAHELERPLNWQIVNLRRDWFDWLDAPVLYISGAKAPNFTDHDYEALRQFAEGGGLIFTHADNGSPEFTAWVAAACHRMFPRYELTAVPANHPIYSVDFKLKRAQPLLSISNDSRLLLIHSSTDIAKGWQLDWTDTDQDDFRLGVNVFVYAAGKSVSYKHRLSSTYIPAAPGPGNGTQSMTRLRYNGVSNPEPYADIRFSRFFRWETGLNLDVPVVDLKSLQPGSTPMAVLTGTVRYDFTDLEVAAARKFVAAGGVLVVDACGGQKAFAHSVEESLLKPAFPEARLDPLPEDHPALIPSRPGADDLRKQIYRSFAVEQVGRLPLLGFRYGHGWVIYSRLDLTTGLLGTQSWGIVGFDPAYCQALMKNLVLWSAARTGKNNGAPSGLPAVQGPAQ